MHSLDASQATDSHTALAPVGSPEGDGPCAVVGVDKPAMVTKLMKVRLGRKSTITGTGFNVTMTGTIRRGQFYVAIDVPADAKFYHEPRPAAPEEQS